MAQLRRMRAVTTAATIAALALVLHCGHSVKPPAPMQLAPFDGVFGHPLRSAFMFDPNTTQFNHGSYGGTPAAVFEQQVKNIRYVEGFILDRITGAWYRDGLLAVRKRVAAYIGAPWEDTVLVDNASNALNVLLNMWCVARVCTIGRQFFLCLAP